ncbi:MAG: hypothetical protein ACYDCO_04070 [Armatimonadota bacterium]
MAGASCWWVSLRRVLHGAPPLDRLLPPFAARYRPGIHAEGSTVTALPPPLRETRYARLRAIAERHHLALRVCACKKPDIAGERCQIAGRWNVKQTGGSQATLFDWERKAEILLYVLI